MHNKNNSEMVKSATLAFCSIRQHVIRDIHFTFGIPNLSQSQDIGQNSNGSFSGFRISLKTKVFIKFLNFCHDIDVKLGAVTKIDKRNTALSREIEDDVMSTNCSAIVFFLIYVKSPYFCQKCWLFAKTLTSAKLRRCWY